MRAGAAAGGVRREQQQQRNPAGPSPVTPTSTPAGAVNTTTITIANNVATPKDIIVPRGSQVTFINNDNRAHDMESNPHPEHTECPALAQVGFLNPGQTRQSGNLTTAQDLRLPRPQPGRCRRASGQHHGPVDHVTCIAAVELLSR